MGLFEVPDVGHGSGELDVAHAVATHLGRGDLDAAALADDALKADALVLAAGALPVLGGTEDLLAEQAVLLGLEGTVIDGLRLLDLTVRPERIWSAEAREIFTESKSVASKSATVNYSLSVVVAATASGASAVSASSASTSASTPASAASRRERRSPRRSQGRRRPRRHRAWARCPVRGSESP